MPINSNYPSSLDSAQNLLVARNNWAATLSANVSASSPDIPMFVAANLPDLQATNGVVSIGSEVIRYSYWEEDQNGVVTLRGCARGYDGTPSTQHLAGERVELRWVAQHHNLLSDAIRKIQGAIGTNPQAGFVDLVARLANTLPVTVLKTNTTDWGFEHSRGRIVSIQLWRLVEPPQDDNYEWFDAPIRQHVVTAGASTVSITLPSNTTGFLIYA